jgi:hypothetical protein
MIVFDGTSTTKRYTYQYPFHGSVHQELSANSAWERTVDFYRIYVEVAYPIEFAGRNKIVSYSE